VDVVRRRTPSPDQRFLGVLDTSPFRIAIVYSIVFACGAAVLLGAVDFAVSRVVDGSTDNLIEAEVQGLREQVLVLSRGDFIELIEQRSQDQDVRGAVYLMVEGVFCIFGALKIREHNGWIFMLLNGIATLALGLMVYAHWPSGSASILGLFFGISLLFHGLSQLMLGLFAPKTLA